MNNMKKMVDTVMVMALLMSSIPGLAEETPADVFPFVMENAGEELPQADGEDGGPGHDDAELQPRENAADTVREEECLHG